MVLQLEPDGARFRILRPFGYRDPAYAEPFIVPKDVATFRTDLASIPWFFAWLVPGLGTHLPGGAAARRAGRGAERRERRTSGPTSTARRRIGSSAMRWRASARRSCGAG